MSRSTSGRRHEPPVIHRLASVLLALTMAAHGKQEKNPAASRMWTNTGGKQIAAEYLGIRGDEVALKLPGGKISFVPLSGLSPADNEFVRANRLDYHEKWQAWPPDASQAMPGFTVEEESTGQGEFVYTTKNFRFHCDVNLGPVLMKDLARTFELTLRLHAKSPFGILAKPEKDRFEAKLYGTLKDYRSAGGPPNSAGVYLHKEKVFLAPLELMGVRAGSAGYRKAPDDYDISTIVHELTHMLTHEMLDNLPTWANEGYAEYIASIPRQGHGFKTDPDKIREGVRDVFVTSHLRATTSSKELPDWSKAERTKYLQGGTVPPLRKIADVLEMTDEEWATGRKSPQSPPDGRVTPFGLAPQPNRLPQLYRTAHLIIYYFIQIEGEKGVTKIRKFLEENRRNMDRYEQYRKEFAAYEGAMRAFLLLPDVTKLPDGRFQYPAHLTPPKAPASPFPDMNALKLGGLDALLDGEPAAAVGARIESALCEDLGIKLTFQ